MDAVVSGPQGLGFLVFWKGKNGKNMETGFCRFELLVGNGRTDPHSSPHTLQKYSGLQFLSQGSRPTSCTFDLLLLA